MKRILFLLSFMFLFSASAVCQQKIQATYEGDIIEGVKLHAFSGSDFFAVKDVAKAYKCTLAWHPVTGKVSLFSGNQRIDFFIKTTRIAVNGRKKRLDQPIRMSGDQVYVPAAFIFSNEFADFTDTVTEWNPDTGILNVEKKVNVLSPRFYSNPKYTQVVIELSEDLPYFWSQKKPGTGVVSITRGKMNEETIGSDDGVIREIDVKNKGREAEIKIFLTEGAGKVERQMLNDPRRIVINIARTPLASAKTDVAIIQSTSPAELFISSPSETVPSGIKPFVAAVNKPDTKREPPKAAVAVSTTQTNTAEIAKEEPEPFSAAKPRSSKQRKLIVLDAGHGGEDPGAIGPNGTKEKDINIAIVQELKKLLDSDDNYQAILSRKDDTFIPLVDRSELANKQHANLFVSVHCNASINRNTGGFEIYFLSESASDPEAQATAVLENSVVRLEGKPSKQREKKQQLLWSLYVNEYINESSEICAFIGSEVCRRTKIENRGVRQAGFYVLRGTEMPAVLVECAFLSHLGEESKLKTRNYQQKIADGIYEGIKRYDENKGI